MAKVFFVLALIVAVASAQPIETIATSGGVSLSTHLWNWGEVAFQALLELAKCALGTSREEISGTKILIATGYPYDDGSNTEVIDVEDSNFRCTKVEPFPVKLKGATGGLMKGQKLFICGGYGNINWDWTYSQDCYQLTEAGSWAKDQTAKLNTARGYAGYGSVVIDNNLYLAGGYNGNDLMSIEKLTPDATTQTMSVQLPTGFYSHCQVPWDSETFFIIGGWGDSKRDETYFINVKTNQLTNGPSLKTARSSHACGELQINGKAYIIVTGGFNNNRDYLISTEVLDKNNVGQGWQKGDDFDLPVDKREFQMVSSPDKKALYAIGGWDGSYRNEIYKFHCSDSIQTCRWTKSKTTLRYGRSYFVAIPIPNSLADKLCK